MNYLEIDGYEQDAIQEGKIEVPDGYYIVVESGSGLYEWKENSFTWVSWKDAEDIGVKWDWQPEKFYKRKRLI